MENVKHSGIVTSIKVSQNSNGNQYTIIGETVLQTVSEINLKLYDTVEISEGKSELKGSATNDDYSNTLSKLIGLLDIDGKAEAIKFEDERYANVARKLMPKLKAAARKLLKAMISGAPMIVRFHNDGDGSAGAIALYRAFQKIQEKLFIGRRSILWEMNRSIAYTLESFYSDKMLFQLYDSVEKPLLIITDFGTSPESEAAVKSASEMCDIIWLDHHLPYEDFPRELITHYINVCDFGADSNFTAGLLTCILSQVLGNADVEDLKAASLISDYSDYADSSDEKAVKESVILDYLTSSPNGPGNKPRHMDSLLKDSELSESTYRNASMMLDSAISAGIKNIKRYKNAEGVNVCVLDFVHVANLRMDYPLLGRYSSKLQYVLESMNNGRTMTIVYFNTYASIRLSADLDGSVDLLGIIGQLNRESNGLISGGGHKQAASIRTSRDNVLHAISLLLSALGISA